jgi:7-cyano-7-deazaguanine reductase
MKTRAKELAGISLLGRSEAVLPKAPSVDFLETFPNPTPQLDYWITLETKEFSSICPVTGQPDFAEMVIQYIPDKVCVETKSLKFYLASYRSTPSFNEKVVGQILDHLVRVLRPRRLVIEGKFARRGGIQLMVNIDYPSCLRKGKRNKPTS